VTYVIRRYPAHLIDVVEAAGRRLVVRPTLPQDTELQREFFGSLSAEARYLRFMARLDDVPDWLMERLAGVDYAAHLALLAETFEDGRECMIGEARYVVDAGDPASCELAIAVADGWRGLGIGRALLERLERQAAASGLRRMGADALAVNQAMIGLAVRAGYTVRTCPEDARLVRLEKRLAVEPPARPALIAA